MITANGGVNLYIGNHPGADGTSAAIPEIRELTGRVGWTCFDYPAVVRGLSKQVGRPLSYREASRIWTERATRFIRENPGEFARVTARRIGLFWGPAEVGNNRDVHFVREGSRFTDVQVHETIVTPPGRVGRLRGRLLHYALRDFGHHAEKVAQYGWLGAQKRFEAGRHGGGVIGATLRSLWVFFVVYVVRLGFLDGPAGFVSAVMYAQVNFNKYAGLWSLRREKSG